MPREPQRARDGGSRHRPLPPSAAQRLPQPPRFPQPPAAPALRQRPKPLPSAGQPSKASAVPHAASRAVRSAQRTASMLPPRLMPHVPREAGGRAGSRRLGRGSGRAHARRAAPIPGGPALRLHCESPSPAPLSARLPLAELRVSATSHLHMTQSRGRSRQRRKTFEELALEPSLCCPRVLLRKSRRMAQQPRAPAERRGWLPAAAPHLNLRGRSSEPRGGELGRGPSLYFCRSEQGN